VPYSFFVNDIEVVSTLESDLKDVFKDLKEATIEINYIPQATYRVNPATRCASTLSGHSESIIVVAFSPDGKRLASGSGDRTVRFWDLNTNTPLPVSPAHKNWIMCLAWSPDGRFLASGSMDNTIQIWDGSSGKPIGQPLRGHTQWITALAWEPLHIESPSMRLVSASKDGSARIWDATRQLCLHALTQHRDAVSSVKWSGSGHIITASRDRTIKIWRPDGSLAKNLEGHGHWINTLALSTDYVLRTGAFDHNGQLKSSDPESMKKAAFDRYQAALTEGHEMLVSGSDDFTMILWNPEVSNKPVARLTGHQALVNQVQFSPNGLFLASASFDKSVKLWSAKTGKFIASLRGHVRSVYQLAWSSDSRLLSSSSSDGTVKLWDIKLRALKQDLPGHRDEVFAIDWSPNGQAIASGGRDKALKM
jgi:ribosome assembly protein 4